MKKKRILKLGFIFTIMFFIWGSFFSILVKAPSLVSLNMVIKGEKEGQIQLFYSKTSEDFTEYNSKKGTYSNSLDAVKINYNYNADRLRLDFEDIPDKITIEKFNIKTLFGTYEFVLNPSSLIYANNIKKVESYKKGLNIITNGSDPYLAWDINESLKKEILSDNELLKKIIVILLSLILCTLSLLIVLKRNSLKANIKDIIINRSIIMKLAKSDFKTKYAGSYLGFIWGYIQPISTILVYWFVFQIGLKITPIENEVPFAVWFIAGLIPWFFFSEALSNATNSFIEYSFLVKKIVFKISVIPIVKIISSLFVHFVFIVFLLIIYVSYGYSFKIYNLQILYYSFCTLILVAGLSYITSAIVVFFKDLGQFISILLQMGMWLTPIMWSEKIISENFRWIFKMNPMYYVVQGYRDSLFGGVWFLENIYSTLWFWLIAGGTLILGNFIFKKLRPHFADAL